VFVADLGLPASEMSRLWAAVGAASKWAAEDGLGAAAVPAQLREQVTFYIFIIFTFLFFVNHWNCVRNESLETIAFVHMENSICVCF
jgi:hypothetical protein